jgi:hypothetical protein
MFMYASANIKHEGIRITKEKLFSFLTLALYRESNCRSKK